MTISSFSGLSQPAQPLDLHRAGVKIQVALDNLVNGSPQSQPADDTTAVSTGSQLQAQLSTLKQTAGNLTQATSLVQVATDGLSQAQDIVGQLQGLASEAGGASLTSNDRKALNQQFQQLSQSLDQLSSASSFAGQPLLDGSISGANSLSLDTLLSAGGSSGDSQTLSLPSVSSTSLLGGTPDILSADTAAQAFGATDTALNTLSSALDNAGGFSQALEFAGATVDSAVANRDAATATLSEADFTAETVDFSPASLQQNPAISIAAQGNLLNPALLQLVG